ncbi:hypothetical protein GCM10010218_12910 [Streptomyces mashuensis]|uniref:Uncharacterized protein n=1 Tax=Streptomyces mashuensis TaxID=33904 RepID=A0A919EA25_9ACTN|nr:hypothetical protein [Streptomyces mashuensis]GHF33233.1 hypothetical protein GCM10010218_12910 [Streptomyces mashuensis]
MSAAIAVKAPSYPAPRTLRELDGLLSNSGGPSAHIIVLPPQLAARLLRRNTKNRNLRTAVVEDYVRDIQAGTWPLNGEAIKLDVQGNVLDGQHRLHAIVKAEEPVTTFIVGGLPPEAQTTMDSGLRRTTADALSLADETNAITVAAILRKVWTWQQGDRRFTRRISPTTTESRALLEKHPEIRRSAEIAMRTRAAFPHIPQSALGTAHFLFNAIDPDECAWFFQRLGDGVELSSGHPILALRSRVTSERAKEGRIAWERHLSYLVSAWNAVRENRPLTRLVVRPDAPVPSPK